jgi:hypothetical protein
MLRAHTIPEAVWCTGEPNREEIAALALPAFLAPAIRPNAPRAFGRAARRPLTSARATGTGIRPRELLAFMVFLDTARCFGVERLFDLDGRPCPMSRALPAARQPSARTAQAISCVVIAQDEEERLPTALASVRPFVEQLIVVDGGSKDRTVDVARSFDAEVVVRPFDRDFGAQQNAGLARVRTPWTLVLDADERIEPALGDLLTSVAATTDAATVYVPFLNLIDELGAEPFRWPDLQPRMFRTGARYEGGVHCELDRHGRSVSTPLSGPFVVHHKDMLRQHRASLLYSSIDPSPYSEEHLAWVRAEITRLEAQRAGSNSR